MQAYHYNLGKKGAAQNLPVFATRTMESRWHTYSVDWEPHIIRWYVDGRLTKPLLALPPRSSTTASTQQRLRSHNRQADVSNLELRPGRSQDPMG